MKLRYKGITFDKFTIQDTKGIKHDISKINSIKDVVGAWGYICKSCADKHGLNTYNLDASSNGMMCYVNGCHSKDTVYDIFVGEDGEIEQLEFIDGGKQTMLETSVTLKVFTKYREDGYNILENIKEVLNSQDVLYSMTNLKIKETSQVTAIAYGTNRDGSFYVQTCCSDEHLGEDCACKNLGNKLLEEEAIELAERKSKEFGVRLYKWY